MIDPSRRRALKALAAAGTVFLADSLNAAPAEGGLKRAVPRSGELLPAVGLGTYQTFDVGASPAERAPLEDVLHRFVELGASVIDSSPMYGEAESVVGDLVQKLRLRPSLFLATKVWTGGREAGIRQMERSFARLRTERIDLMQVHNLVDVETHLPTLRAWRDRGHIRHLGVTHYHSGAYGELERCLRTGEYGFVQFNYSLAERDAEQRMLPVAAETRAAVIVNRPFANGELFRQVRGKPLPDWAAEFDCASWAQFFLKYVLGHPAVTCVIPATSRPEHLVDNLGAARGRLPDAGMRKRMAEYVDRL